MPKKMSNDMVQLIRNRSKLYKKFAAYEKERAYLLKALKELKPPTPAEYEQLTKYDLEISRNTINMLER
jgi:hypothetical protein